MKTAVRLLIIMAAGAVFFGCSGKGGDQPQGSKADQKAAEANDKELALKFLQGIQDGDKIKMYAAANLTNDIVNDSRDKLIHPSKYNQTDQQRKDSEHALRTSGNIDFFVSKLKMMFPKSVSFQITQASAKILPDSAKVTDHTVKLAYANKDEAMRDKTGKPVKEMVINLVQVSRSVNGRWINDFSFESKAFDKMAEKEFEVVSYY